MKLKHILIGAIGGIFLYGCQNDKTRPPYTEQWAHERDVSIMRDRINGYNGSFACHTADGGCLHMSCSTKSSCDYMAQAEKTCAVPTSKDKLVIVEDDNCKATMAATSFAPSGTITPGNGSWMITNPSTSIH